MTEVSAESRSPLGWASFLAASWTWVIGMFLPVLLVRDYGMWAWVIFAVPNCIGAAAMGWTMRSAEQSRRFVIDHAIACRLFSLVTIAFHLFVLAWLLPRLIGPWGYIGAAVLVQAAFTPILRSRLTLILSALALLISVSMAIGLGSRGTLESPPALTMSAGNSIGLLLVCLLGFGLCPYLDLTFHRARQATSDAGAKVAFGVGFCVMFLSMIVITLLYATNFLRLASIDAGTVSAWLLAIHLTAQATFTSMVHAASLVKQAEARDDVGVMRSALGAALGVGLVGAVIGTFSWEHNLVYRGLMDLGELIYRSFMSFYGLIAPAYLCIVLFGGRATWARWALVCAVAIPFYWIGFVEKQMAWTGVGVVVAVVGAWVASRVKPPAPAEPIG